MEKVRILHSTPFSLSLSEDEMVEFAKIFQYRRVPPGRVIFQERSTGKAWYIVGNGTVDVSLSPSGKVHESQFVCSKQGGDFFGDPTVLIEDKDRTMINTVVSSKNDGGCSVLELTKPLLDRFLKKNPHLREQIFQIIGKRIENDLGKISFLSSLGAQEKILLGSMLHYIPLKKDHVLFEEGSIGKSLFLVYRGTVNAISVTKDGNEILLNVIGEGQYFGEIGLMVDMPRTATIRATEDCLLLELKKNDFNNFLTLAPESSKDIQAKVMQRIADHFRKYSVPFFESIPDDKYVLLADLCNLESFEADCVIFEEGDIGQKFYIIAHGELEASIIDPDSKTKRVLTVLTPGMYFGEISLVKDTARTATLRTITKSVLLSITKENFDRFFDEVPEAIVDFQVKLSRFDAELKHFIHHKIGLEYFTRHLEAEYSTENIMFWKEVQVYKSLTDDERKEAARRICDLYLTPSSEREINIIGKLKSKILDKVSNGDYSRSLFTECQLEVIHIMETDSFKRFKQSSLFHEFLDNNTAYSKENVRLKSALRPNLKTSASSPVPLSQSELKSSLSQMINNESRKTAELGVFAD